MPTCDIHLPSKLHHFVNSLTAVGRVLRRETEHVLSAQYSFKGQ